MGLTFPQSYAAVRHISRHAGDLSKPNLGLKPDVYRELATTLDTVIHNGALVNHAFTYEQLFEPNVLGSLEVWISMASFQCAIQISKQGSKVVAGAPSIWAALACDLSLLLFLASASCSLSACKPESCLGWQQS